MSQGLLLTTDQFGQRLSPQAKRRMLEAHDLGLTPVGHYSEITVAHVDWCGVLNGTDICLCRPDLRITAPDGKRWLSPATERWRQER